MVVRLDTYMKKFSLLVILIVIVLALSTTGCSSGNNPGKAVTLSYALWDKNQLPAMQDIAKAFMEKNPNIKVNVELTPGGGNYWSKMDTAAIGNTMPDVFWMNPKVFEKYASNNQIMPLNDLIDKDGFNMNNYRKSVIDQATYNGKIYGIPKDIGSIALWYNKKLFDEAHVKYPDETWDWKKYLEAIKKLTNPAKGVWGIGAEMDGQDLFYNTIFQNEGYVVSADHKTSGYDQPATVEAIKFWTDVINVYKASPSLAQMNDSSPMDMFKSGKLAMIQDGSWDASDYANNEYTKNIVDVTVLPKGKIRAVIADGLSNVIAASTKHPKEAWTFLKFLGSKEAAEIQAKTGTVIPAYIGTEQIWVKSIPQFNLNAYIQGLDYSKPTPVTKDGQKWRDLEDQYLTKAWTGELSAEEACKQLALEMNKVLSQEK